MRPSRLLRLLTMSSQRKSSSSSFSSVDLEQRTMSDQAIIDFDSLSTITLRCSLDSRGQTEFEWTDYSPGVFRNIQESDDVDVDGYMNAIRGHDTLKVLLQAKKNTSIHLSHDDRFIIKTINKSEMKVFLEMLPRYYQHIQKNKNTLLTKFYGLHVVKPSSGQKVRFVVTGNVLRADVVIHKQFNLKVASHSRNINKTGTDEELNMAFHLHPTARRQFMLQIKCDCNFLEEVGIMNYNFLLGMHVCTAPFEAVVKGRYASGSEDSQQANGSAAQPPGADKDLELSYSSEPVHRLGVKVGARAVDSSKKEYNLASNRNTGKQLNNVILYFGITNILQGYSMLKQVEHVFKTLQSDTPTGLATNPRTYSSRFQEYICKIFAENDSES